MQAAIDRMAALAHAAVQAAAVQDQASESELKAQPEAAELTSLRQPSSNIKHS